jgi:hypothetical protein
LTFTLTMMCHAVQVYGGAVGVIVGPYARSSIQTGHSFSSCESTTCIDCNLNVSGTSITNSSALSNTSGDFPAILVLTRILNYRRFLPTMISDIVHRQLVRSVCKSYRRRVQNTARFTFAPQVYGGGVAFVVQPHVWSSNSFLPQSSTSAGDTAVSGLSAVVFNCSFFGSTALTRTIGARDPICDLVSSSV